MSDETSLVRARTIARALDSAVKIPGTNIRFGLDALLGLIPGFGDVAGAALSGYLVLLASKAGAPSSVVIRMVGNVLIDTLFGVVPVLGDLFDVAWKANTRNLALLERYAVVPEKTRRTSGALVAGTIAALLLLVIGGIVGAILLLRALPALLG